MKVKFQKRQILVKLIQLFKKSLEELMKRFSSKLELSKLQTGYDKKF